MNFEHVHCISIWSDAILVRDDVGIRLYLTSLRMGLLSRDPLKVNLDEVNVDETGVFEAS